MILLKHQHDYKKVFAEQGIVPIEAVNGDKAWYLNGKRHREDGPAIKHVK